MEADRTEYIMYDFIYIKFKTWVNAARSQDSCHIWGEVVLMGEWNPGNVLLIRVLVRQVCSVFEKSSSHIFMMCTFFCFCVLCINKLLIFFNFQQSFKARKITLPSSWQPEYIFHLTQRSFHLAWHLLHICIPHGTR